MLKIPFYKNSGDGMRCMQACVGMVAEYFLGQKFLLDDLDRLTERKNGKWTYTVQGVSALHNLGLEVVYYSTHNPEGYLQGEEYIKQTFGKDAERILKFTDLSVLQNAITIMKDNNLFSQNDLSLGEIKSMMKDKGAVPIILVNINKINDKGDNFYTGHFVVVTEIDDKFVYYHDSGPKNAGTNKKVSKEIFEQARERQTTKKSVIMTYGSCKK